MAKIVYTLPLRWDMHVKMVSFLLSLKEIDVNLANESGETCLHAACDGGHLEVIKVRSFCRLLSLAQ